MQSKLSHPSRSHQSTRSGIWEGEGVFERTVTGTGVKGAVAIDCSSELLHLHDHAVKRLLHLRWRHRTVDREDRRLRERNLAPDDHSRCAGLCHHRPDLVRIIEDVKLVVTHGDDVTVLIEQTDLDMGVVEEREPNRVTSHRGLVPVEEDFCDLGFDSHATSVGEPRGRMSIPNCVGEQRNRILGNVGQGAQTGDILVKETGGTQDGVNVTHDLVCVLVIPL
ncbi:hypothetical protein UFOVP1329_9 [uncultured Caudovirales phage]|uniref:Uncharacterized protein n=1 Tax=uncultured Caudovirales phage TaxID=2100421 RepID=A0A6J5STH0_9CAUD|nr:hypothetical protein UFOVP1150_34 [uncultured Caudovirales phage]CAB4198945.1 hypothetical protein UFOVP1329_9 [uncultured Caudovirales phage]CAB4218609.1 hypothetical protein UFOVP1595_27 [uncultured Caudovirales phage]